MREGVNCHGSYLSLDLVGEGEGRRIGMQKPDHKCLVCCAEEFGFYPEAAGKP